MKYIIILSLAIYAVARPSISDRALRIPLERRISTQWATGKQFLGAHGVQRLVSYTHKKYEATFAAYERNTGSRHPLDMLPRSSSTLPSNLASRGDVRLENEQAYMWYGEFEIGTPPQKFTADYDTGSADLWLPDKCCTTCYGHRRYDASQSSTSRDTIKPSVLQYGSGTAIISHVYKDTVQVAGCTLLNQEFGGAAATSFDFWSNQMPVSGSFPADSLFGFGFKKISALDVTPPVENMKNNSQLLEGYLSFRLSVVPGLSELIVGDANYKAFKTDTRISVPVMDEGYWQITLGGMRRSGSRPVLGIARPAIVDTGTTLIIVPTDIANGYFSGVDGAQCVSGVCTVPCNVIDSTTPIFTFQGRNFSVSPCTWNFGPDGDGSTNCITAMGTSDTLPLIIGDAFLQNVYTIFDFRKLCVDFAELVDPVCT